MNGDGGQATRVSHSSTTRRVRRNPVRLFVRIKDLRDVDPKHECFTCRFRLFAYFNDTQLENMIVADMKHESLDSLAARHFKVKMSQLSREVQDMLPHVMLQNKVHQDTFHEPEFMVKPFETTGFHFCLTEEYALRLNHEYDMRKFPFDQHALGIELALTKAAEIKRWKLEVVDDTSFRDPEESIPFYLEREQRPWMPNGWRKHARAPFELANFDTAEWIIHADGGNVLPWDDRRADDKKSTVRFLLHVTRRHKLYFRDFMLLNSAIVTLGFLSPAGGTADFNDRFANDLVLLLTSVAFSIAMSGNLPALPYVTWLSFHFNVSIATVFVLSVMHAFQTVSEVTFLIDVMMHAIVFAFWIAYHGW